MPSSHPPPTIPVDAIDAAGKDLKIQVSSPDQQRFLFRFEDSYKFATTNALFHSLRSALTAYLDTVDPVKEEDGKKRFLLMRYAACVSPANFPFIHDHHSCSIFFDPLQPFRSPLAQVARFKEIELLRYKARPHYWRERTTEHRRRPEDPVLVEVRSPDSDSS